ncbi:hypothetical protein [Nonlabens sp. Asnod3-A02]|uniref:hypothetical protein n=1 Tax=Nonlabens sp. Asnod3-A02 TaxID=3160579 RepID=UPI0038651537
MKKLIVLIAVIFAISSCKEDTKAPTTTSDSSHMIPSTTTRNVKTSVKSSGNVTVVDKTKSTPAIAQDLIAFNGLEALKYIELEGLKPEMNLEELQNVNIKANQNMEPTIKVSGDGQIPIYQITKSGFPMVDIYYTADQVTDIALTHKNATPPKMIGIGNTYAELLSVYPNAKAMGSEVESRVTVTVDNVVFTLNVNHGINEVYDAPLTSKIKYLSFK